MKIDKKDLKTMEKKLLKFYNSLECKEKIFFVHFFFSEKANEIIFTKDLDERGEHSKKSV